MMEKKLLMFLQILVYITLYLIIDDIKNNFVVEIGFFLTRVFFLNTLLCVLYFIKKSENDILFDSDDMFLFADNSLNYFHVFWVINVLLNLGMIVYQYEKRTFIRQKSYEDWIYIFSMYLSTYLHYGLHNKISYFTQLNPQSTVACAFHFIHYSSSFISFLSCLVINHLQRADDDYKEVQKLLFFLIFCKFFTILRMPIAGDIGKICYSLVLLVDIKMKIQVINESLDEQNQVKNDDQNNNSNQTDIDKFPPQVQFLIVLSLIIFSILCFSVYRVYLAWKQLDANCLFQNRSGFIGDQRLNVLIQQNYEIRQRAKSTDGLSEFELQQLKKSQLIANQKESCQNMPNHTCSICFLEIQNKNDIFVLQCGHKYHSSCLETWLKNKNSCPNCRQKVIQRDQLTIQNISNQINLQSDNSQINNQQQLEVFEEFIRQQSIESYQGQLNSQNAPQTSAENLNQGQQTYPHTADTLINDLEMQIQQS